MAVVAATATTAIVFLPLIVGEKTELQIWLGEVASPSPSRSSARCWCR